MIKRASKVRLIFMNSLLFILCLAWIIACAIQVFDLVWLGQFHIGTGRLLGFSPLAAIGAFWTFRSLMRLRNRDIRLEADEDGVRWVNINGEYWAAWSNLSVWRLNSRTSTAIEADLVGPNVSPKLQGDKRFVLSARALDMEGRDLAAELNAMREKAISDGSAV